MKLTMRTLIAAWIILICLGQGIAMAAVQPGTIFINSLVTNYTVPAGKVFLIEHLSAWQANNILATPRIIVRTKTDNFNAGGGTLVVDWGFPVTDKFQDVTLLRPLRIPAGGSVQINGTLGFN